MLAQKTRDIRKLARVKAKKELQGCTFKPAVDKKSRLMAKTSRANSESGPDQLYANLHKQHKEKIAKYESLKM